MVVAERVWSSYQEAIFDALEHSTDSLVIGAVAGSGKTSTLVECAHRLDEYSNAAAIAFSKRIADELARRLPPFVSSLTLNALGNRAWVSHVGKRVPVDSHKITTLIRSLADDSTPDYRKGVKRLVDLAKTAGIVPTYIKEPTHALLPDTTTNWESLIEEYGISFGWGDRWARAIELGRRVLAESIRIGGQSIDFNDQLYLPVVFGSDFPQYDILFVDEAQDLSAIQHVMVERSVSAKGRVIAFGDQGQCQPPGTKVRTPSGYKLIEELVDGENVTSVDVSHSVFKVSGDKVKINNRSYTGVMTTIESSGRSSRYTAEHRCIVLCKPLAGKYAVYLMQKGLNFRIGSTQFGTSTGSGPRTRMLTEKADRLWILLLCDTKQEATLNEALLSAQHRIPERTFIAQTADGCRGLSQGFLDDFWDMCPDTQRAASILLGLFNREYSHPFVEKGFPFTFSVRRPSIVRACNLLDGMLVLHDEKELHYKKHSWKPIQIHRYNYAGFVYSLDVANKHTYIADGIATHNSIYQFRGAGKDSIPQLQKKFGARALPLSISYRCSRAVVRYAKQYQPQIEPADEAPEGSVTDCASWKAEDFRSTDAVLCRNNAPLVKLAFRLLRGGKPCKVLGRDIGSGLVSLVQRLRASTIRELAEKLDNFVVREMTSITDRPDQVAALMDRADTLRVFMENASTPAEVVSKIEGLFADVVESYLTLSSVHKAKGLEWPRVWILDFQLVGARASTDYERQAESNVAYVAVTRAQKDLFFIRS